AGAGSMWLIGAISHNDRLAQTGQKSTQGVLDAAVFGEIVKQIAVRQNSRYIDYRASGVAVRAFTFASIMNRQYHDKPWAIVGSSGFATAASLASMSGPKRFPTDVLISAAAGEVIGRILTHHRPPDR